MRHVNCLGDVVVPTCHKSTFVGFRGNQGVVRTIGVIIRHVDVIRPGVDTGSAIAGIGNSPGEFDWMSGGSGVRGGSRSYLKIHGGIGETYLGSGDQGIVAGVFFRLGIFAIPRILPQVNPKDEVIVPGGKPRRYYGHGTGYLNAVRCEWCKAADRIPAKPGVIPRIKIRVG